MYAEDAAILTYALPAHSPDDVVYRLLTHPVPAVAAAAALLFGIGDGYGMRLPDEWHGPWQRAIVHLRLDHTGNSMAWRLTAMLGQLVAHEPEVAAEWFARRFAELADARVLVQLEPRGCEQQLSALPDPHRERLARIYASLDGPRIGPSPLVHLLGADPALAERLLAEHVVSANQLLDAIAGRRDAIEQLGGLLLGHGVEP
jgi:hypothetical protein